MLSRRKLIIGIVLVAAAGLYTYKSVKNHARLPGVPKTWDDAAMADLQLPLASAAHSPKLISASSYYWIPVRSIYKTYPVYHPEREPAGYLEWLKQQEPQNVWDAIKLDSADDWIAAGKLVFEVPLFNGSIAPTSSEYQSSLYIRDKRWHEQVAAPIAADGTLPFYRYVVERKSEVQVGLLSCATCHTRVLDDGTVVYGGQGNLPFDKAFAYDYRFGNGELAQHNGLERLLYLRSLDRRRRRAMVENGEAIAARHDAIPAGVMARHGSSPFHPVAIPDLFDLKHRRYLDRTGLQQNRGVVDVMRYAALNQGADDLSAYGEFTPLTDMLGFTVPSFLNLRGRYSDDQLYALALYIDSLKPPVNPHPFDELAQKGQHLFEMQDCARCHTPPLYSSNKLTPVEGFEIPQVHRDRYAIEDESLGTDAGLVLNTRRGTGYYKIPSLKNVWLRSPLGHDGSCATLEDWFDPRRLEQDYVPTGFVGQNVKARAVPGHEYGLDLDEPERQALIAFLRTL